MTIPNVYEPDNRMSNNMRQKPNGIARRIDGFTIVVGDFQSHLSEMDRSSRQKINKVIVELNNSCSPERGRKHLSNVSNKIFLRTWEIVGISCDLIYLMSAAYYNKLQ